MKVILNGWVEGLSGQFGEIVFRQVNGKTIAARKPRSSAPSDVQVEHRERFKQAVVFGKSVMANSSLRALYEAVAKSKDMPVFAATIADFFNAPVIAELDLSTYTGQVGDLIRIDARDDFGVASVHVSILTEQNVTLENGMAVETPAGSGQWIYTATVLATNETSVNVQAVATDRPGGSAVTTVNKSL